MDGPLCLLGFLLLATVVQVDAAKRFHDVLSNEAPSSSLREHSQLEGWSSDKNEWNEKLYPVWKRGDSRWKNSWKGGRVQASLTSDSPALVGSTITFVVTLVFPRCQKEDADGNIVYEKNCRNETGPLPETYVYNWTAGTDNGDWGNSSGHHHVFPDGRPFPRPPGWRKRHFVYVFHTFGQYFQKLGQCSASISINTTNMTVGPQLMEVAVYRRQGHTYIPVTKVKDMYVVTDQIPLLVTMSQKNNRNVSDETFLRDLPIIFDVLIHDPSHFLNQSALYYKWKFGDNTSLLVSHDHTLNHTYMLNGTFDLNLTVQATVPGPCPSPTPVPTPSPGPLNTTTRGKCSMIHNPYSNLPVSTSDSCLVNRYGYFKAVLIIVEGILQVDIIQMTHVTESLPWPEPKEDMMDFVVTCQGALPKEVCTVIADPTCQVAQNTVCDSVAPGLADSCLLTVRRAFSSSGMFCMNLTLGNGESLALTSTLISVPARAPVSPLRTVNNVLVSIGCVAVLVTAIAFFMYKKHKEYKPIENSTGIVVRGQRLNVFLHRAKAIFLPRSQEKDPLLKDQQARL
ncbi:transmembrane glycoprotein NMB [Suncus etruscus]|uniref:transmembrane glycoprotein NMB n=1 Tax=Suncus etruscus TaxID=109475 RepID=UPI00210FFF07|nr:transmembrane glycoprotein NMB [Suncus etruscus]